MIWVSPGWISLNNHYCGLFDQTDEPQTALLRQCGWMKVWRLRPGQPCVCQASRCLWLHVNRWGRKYEAVPSSGISSRNSVGLISMATTTSVSVGTESHMLYNAGSKTTRLVLRYSLTTLISSVSYYAHSLRHNGAVWVSFRTVARILEIVRSYTMNPLRIFWPDTKKKKKKLKYE